MKEPELPDGWSIGQDSHHFVLNDCIIGRHLIKNGVPIAIIVLRMAEHYTAKYYYAPEVRDVVDAILVEYGTAKDQYNAYWQEKLLRERMEKDERNRFAAIKAVFGDEGAR